MAFFIQVKCKFIYEQTFYQWKILFVIFQFLHQLYEPYLSRVSLTQIGIKFIIRFFWN